MSVIAESRRTDNVASDQRYIDIAKPILLLEPEAAPLTVITKSLASKSCGDPKFKWVEDERDDRFDAINHAEEYAANATELAVDTGELFYVGALVMVPSTNEIIRVKKVEGNTLKEVTRGYAGTTAAKLPDNTPLYVMGVAAEEGSSSFSARSSNPVTKENFTQIFKKSVEASGTWLSSSNQTSPHDWVHQHKKANIEHLVSIENAALFGAPKEQEGPNGGEIRTTGGALHFLTENNQAAGGELTETEWEEFVRTICRYGNKKVLFASPLLLSVINGFAVGKLQTIQADRDTTYGINVQEYISAHGSIKLVKHNLLEGATWGGYGIALDYTENPPEYRYLNGDGPGGSRDTHLKTNIQTPDQDGQKDEILTECGFAIKQIKKGGVLTGVTK
jgi:hypothetical protein